MKRATELKKIAEDEVSFYERTARTFEVDRKKLQQELQDLEGLVAHLRATTTMLLGEFASKLDLEFNKSRGKNHSIREYAMKEC